MDSDHPALLLSNGCFLIDCTSETTGNKHLTAAQSDNGWMHNSIPVVWPPRSPDFTPPEFYGWMEYKSQDEAVNVHSVERTVTVGNTVMSWVGKDFSV
jgi:hypothetical protein